MEYDLGLLAYRLTAEEDGAVSIERHAAQSADRMIWEDHRPEGPLKPAIAHTIVQDFQDEARADRLAENFVDDFLTEFPDDCQELLIEAGDLQRWLEKLGVNLKSVPEASPTENGDE